MALATAPKFQFNRPQQPVAGVKYDLAAQPQAAAPAAPAPAPAPQQQAPADAGYLRGLFSGVKAARDKVDANYLSVGDYLFQIQKVFVRKNRKNLDCFIVAGVIVHAYDDNGGQGHRVGEEVSWLTSPGNYFLSDVKGFISAACSYDFAQASDQEAVEACTMVCLPDQPLTGTTVRVVARPTHTKTGSLYTLVNWKHEVSASAILEMVRSGQMSEEQKNAFWPAGWLENVAANDAAQYAPAGQ